MVSASIFVMTLVAVARLPAAVRARMSLDHPSNRAQLPTPPGAGRPSAPLA
jgi:hypothetical protein